MIVHNLLVDSLQVLFLVTACGMAMTVLRLPSPRARLLSLQFVLLLALLLPALQPRAEIRERVTVSSFGALPITGAAAAPSQFSLPSANTILFGLLLAGAGVRLAWMGAGLVRLSRYRRDAAPAPALHEKLQRLLGVQARFYYSSEVSGPVTFGFFRPSILLPPACAESELIACHELFHVRRRDWAIALFEQLVLALFWFHPAIWWLIARIQLEREEVVDREVVEIFPEREAYLNTLLEAAAMRSSSDLAPAPLFLKKRHLKQRVASLLREVPVMTRRRSFSAATALAATAAIVIFFCARALPLQAAPQLDDSNYIEIGTGPAKLLHRAAVAYPAAVRAAHIEGTVTAQLTLDSSGEVTDARIVSGPEELRGAVLSSVLKWHFAPDSNLPSPLEVTVTFKASGATPVALSSFPWPPGLPRDRTLTLSSIDLSAVPPALRDAVSQAIPLRQGETVSWSDMAALSASLKEVDEHLALSLHTTDNQTVSIRVGVPGYGPMRIRVGGNVQATNLIHKVIPAYPPDAKAARIQGTVRFTAEIGKDGTIQNLELVSGHPILVQAARDAVRQWVYRPTLLNGKPVDVITTIDVNFTLSQ